MQQWVLHQPIIDETTTAEPPISVIISSIPPAGFKDIPPVSNVTPLPTNIVGYLFFFKFHSKITTRGSLTLP